MRRLVALLAIPALALALSGTAQAKGAIPLSAKLTGPGLTSPIIFGDPTPYGRSSAQGSVSLLANESYFFDGLYDGSMTAGPPPGRLGPRYTIVWRMQREFDTGPVFKVRSDLYPFAAGGIVMYTHGGQVVHDAPNHTMTLGGGWSKANPILRVNLRAWGLPKSAAKALQHPQTATALGAWWAIPIALLVLIATAAVRVIRKGRTATP